MNELINLIWLTHPTALNEAISEYESSGDLDEAAANVISALYTDDTFNEYSESELQAVIAEAIADGYRE